MKLKFILVSVITLLVLSACSSNEGKVLNILPTAKKYEYVYEIYDGDTLLSKFYSENRYHTGTNWVQMVGYSSEDEDTMWNEIFYQDESGFYYVDTIFDEKGDESGKLLDDYQDEENTDIAFISYPIKVGKKWTWGEGENEMRLEIVAADAAIQTPYRTFHNAVKIKIDNDYFDEPVYYHYVEDIGTVHMEYYNGDDVLITQVLADFKEK